MKQLIFNLLATSAVVIFGIVRLLSREEILE